MKTTPFTIADGKAGFPRSARCTKLTRVASVLCLALWAAVPRTSAQSRATLGLGFCPSLSVTGEVGTVYAIQATSDMAQTNGWTCVALIQLPATDYVWPDTSDIATTGRRFYRAVAAWTNLIFVLPGTFTMGSPTSEAQRAADETQHMVKISRGFWMGEYLVTQADYLGVVGINPSYFNGVATNGINYGIDLTRPVEQVSWSNATNYCALRTRQEQAAALIPMSYEYRLPTESEWEYACRAGTTTAFYLGNALASGLANFNGQQEYDTQDGTISNPVGTWLHQTTPVGSYAPNLWGFYDMIGNVWQWCQDWVGPYPAPGEYPVAAVVDPQGPASGSNRIFRGGSYTFGAVACRSANRGWTSLSRATSVGFRVVLAPVH